jgi:virulence-associated protein VapD
VFAIAFDLDTRSTRIAHPKGLTQAYTDIGSILNQHGFVWRQGSVYTSESEDLAALLMAMNALKALPWFSPAVRDIRAFRVEQWSDFTSFMKSS